MESTNLVPQLVIIIVAIVEWLRSWKGKWFSDVLHTNVGPRLVSIVLGILAGGLVWISTIEPDLAFVHELFGMKDVTIKWYVALIQGGVAGALGTAGIAILNNVAKKVRG